MCKRPMRVVRSIGHCSTRFGKAASAEIRKHLRSKDEILVPVLPGGSVEISWNAIAVEKTRRLEHVFTGEGEEFAQRPKADLGRTNVRFVDDGENVALYLGSEPCAELSNGRESFRVVFEIGDDALVIRAI